MTRTEGRLTLSFVGAAIVDGAVAVELLASKLQALQNLFFHAAASVAGDTTWRRGLWKNRYRSDAELTFVAAHPGSLVVQIDLPQQPSSLSGNLNIADRSVDLVFKFGASLQERAQGLDLNIRQDDESYLLRAFDALVPAPHEDYTLELTNAGRDKYRPLVLNGATKEAIRRRLARETLPTFVEVATLLGELVKIHVGVSPEKIAVRVGGREIDCFYPNALRDQMANLLAGSMVEVTGDATIDSQSQVIKIDRVIDVTTISMDPLRITRFEYGGTRYQLKQPLMVEVELIDGLWVYHSPLINLWGYGERREDALSELYENFAYLWREFALEEDDVLDDRARQIKRRLLRLVEGHGVGA